MEINFVTKNPHKAQEVKAILGDIGVSIVHAPLKIHEIQAEDINHIVRDKVLKAFNQVGRPVFIEHTGLYIDSLQGFPGGLTQVFWDKLQAEKFTELFGRLENTSVTAKTVIAFCDARKVHIFEGSVKGNIAPEPRGNKDFQWDCVFIPENFEETFSEMGDKKNDISMRKMAFDNFREFLVSEVL
ncbi:MAG: nucleoside-triphosphatase [Alcanivorax borkumensis]|uniref:Ham1 family protein n=1 Tax=Alcanivorax borkumensis (strain ATCC 700651 / DSM 11573 / NCIMB 13689 / SK2) TaxID=393595 RepID=Q0VNC3_ALCBS|nr:non-canonical purine NTP pyrophosphatase [Alcanivorax borkumensis]OJH08093.1 MAG: nucleoside-triphosphatase [Alcanivorax borkumensis]CAL17325.1 Ham1 family protein [Alcanivorax borkumensis SK2]